MATGNPTTSTAFLTTAVFGFILLGGHELRATSAESPRGAPSADLGRPHDGLALGGEWIQRVITVAPTPRSGHEMAYDVQAEEMVLFGGNNLADTWVWDGVDIRWTEVAQGEGPPARSFHDMVYDHCRDVVVLFGGQFGSTNFGDTWEWDGATWTLVDDYEGGIEPDPRRQHALAFDRDRCVTVLFSGIGPNRFNDTWEWDGETWSLVGAAGPCGRTGHEMAYDEARGEVVLFGGRCDTGVKGDTWLWDGVEWREATDATQPSARELHELVYDREREVVVMYGASGAPSWEETWEWDGVQWTLATPKSSPPGRSSSALAWDELREVTVMFGGLVPGADGTTWEYSGADQPRLELTCGGVSVCPQGTFGYRASVSNETGFSYELRVSALEGDGIPATQTLERIAVPPGSSEVVEQIRTPGTIPTTCPANVVVEAVLSDSFGATVRSTTCSIDFLEETP